VHHLVGPVLNIAEAEQQRRIDPVTNALDNFV
jgi:hypothetical protein